MPGPKTVADAVPWIQDAVRDGRYIRSKHFVERMEQRGIDMNDVFTAIERATSVRPYPAGKVTNDGTAWRVVGPSTDGDDTVGIGVEAFLDKKKRRVILVTVFMKGE